MSDEGGTFRKVKQDDPTRLFGPRALLLCGLDPEEQDAVQGMADFLKDLPVIVVRAEDATETVGSLVGLKDGHGFGVETELPRAMIISGLEGQELHMIMAAWRKMKLEQPLWATLTPVSQNWPLSKLLAELLAEDKLYN